MEKEKKIKRIGIDARFYGPVGKGLGRYAQQVVDNIIRFDQINEYVIFLRRENFDIFQSDNPRVTKLLTNIKWYSLAEQILLPFYIWRQRLDLMHFTHFNVPIFCPAKFLVTIHDLILTRHPTKRSFWQFYWLKNLAYQLVIRLAVWRAEKILTASQFSKNDLIGRFKIKPEKIQVVNYGTADLSPAEGGLLGRLPDKQTILSKYGINGNFMLYVGNAYPHKNLETLIEVFWEFHKKYADFRLVLVGREDYFYRSLKQKDQVMSGGDNSPVIFTGYVPDAELKILFKAASFYIFPSLHEGFGLPPLEAMAEGCPVLSSDKSCLPEILGEAALYFDPLNKKDMLFKMIRLVENKNLREKFIEAGYKKSKKYDWQDCARQVLEVYRKILQKNIFL